MAQIFQTNNSSRWQSVKWGIRMLVFLLVILAGVLFITLKNASVDKPNIPLGEHAIKKAITGESELYKPSKLASQYGGFKKLIDDKWKKGKGCGQIDSVLDLSTTSMFSDSTGIRAGFFVNWDHQSFVSLRQNISKLNLVLPEWFFINPNADTLEVNIEKDALKIIQSSGVKVMPMLSNSYKSSFNGIALHRILHDEKKKTKLIKDIIKYLVQYNFAGINIDFEELQEAQSSFLSNFQQELFIALHAQGFMVTQNVMPFNDDYDYASLAKNNDYIFLMAYDEFSESTKAGPICSQKWIEAAVDELVKHVNPSKVVLNLAAYGHDWSKDTITNLTYQEALTTARESEGIIDFDSKTYNLHYSYYDGNDVVHQVHFTDAATNFNTLRFATEFGLAGTAVWRLGSEDSRLWSFYNKPMTKDFLQDFDFSVFTDIKATNTPDFIGEGEVLDMVATPTTGSCKLEMDTSDMVITEETYDKLPSSYVVRKFGKTSKKQLVLTYDDGPDPVYTKEILDTLAHYHVPASFFIVGMEAENNLQLLKRIYREGHEIGNHTFTHPNMANVSKQRALMEMDLTRLLIECVTGHSTIMFRPPYNADSDPDKFEELQPVALSRTRNYITVGEAIDPEDWEKGERPDFNSDTIFNRVLRIYNAHLLSGDSTNIILLHDAGGDRSETVLATGKIIRHFQALGYTFTTVANLLGKKPDDVMPPVPKSSGYYFIQFNTLLFEIGYIGGKFLYALFLTFMILSSLRLMIVGTLAVLQKRREKKLTVDRRPLSENRLPLTDIAGASLLVNNPPLVSIIVPAYNEEVNIVNSIQNLLRCTYPDFEIIFVDDGSKDQTLQKVNDTFSSNTAIRIFTKPNGGKAAALNFGIEQSLADFVVCIDADTRLAPDAVEKLMESFAMDKKIGAVAGIVKVVNEVNLLTKWQSIEYVTSQNFDRKCFAYINAITVVPGAIGAFKKEALAQAGGFTTDTLAEDCDITIRILKAGYIVANQPLAIAYTEVPENIRQFMKQRFRWTFGVLQAFWKNKDAFLNSNQKGLGYFALPDILMFKYFIPFFTPIADFFMFVGLATGNAAKIGKYYLLFMIIDTLIALVAFIVEKEKISKLIWLIPQRLAYRWLMMIILFRALKRAIKGELQHWGILKRTGNVNME